MSCKKQNPAEKVLEIINRIYHNGMTTTSGGNISTIDEEGNIYITPSGVDKGTLTIDDIMKVTPSGEQIGKHKPSCELPFHSKVYKLRPDIKAIVHAHAPAIVAFAVTRTIPNTKITSHIKNICGNIYTSTYALPGSLKLGDIISKEFEKGYDLIMMDNHGAVVGSKDLDTAFSLYETLDFAARMQINAISIGGNISESNLELKNPVFEEFVSDKYSEEEYNLRTEICKMASRSYDLRIMNSTTGTISQRLSENSFLITPYGGDRKKLQPDDIVKIENGKAEQGKIPSRAAKLHEFLYNIKPYMNSIFMAQPPNIMGFVLTGKDFDSRLIPESYIMLRDVKRVPSESLVDYDKLAAVFGKEVPVVLIEGECVITAGKSLIQAFDRLEVLEYSANSVISSLKMGNINSISDEEVEEINGSFKGW